MNNFSKDNMNTVKENVIMDIHVFLKLLFLFLSLMYSYGWPFQAEISDQNQEKNQEMPIILIRLDVKMQLLTLTFLGPSDEALFCFLGVSMLNILSRLPNTEAFRDLGVNSPSKPSAEAALLDLITRFLKFHNQYNK